jgi:hypothetical protein
LQHDHGNNLNSALNKTKSGTVCSSNLPGALWLIVIVVMAPMTASMLVAAWWRYTVFLSVSGILGCAGQRKAAAALVTSGAERGALGMVPVAIALGIGVCGPCHKSRSQGSAKQ